MLSNEAIVESRRITFLLTCVGGFLELYSYLLKGKVFATAITGNLVLMVYNMKNFSFYNIEKYLLPIIAFCFAVAMVELIRQNFENKFNMNWRIYVLVFEIIALLILSMIKSNIISTSIIAFVSAIQIQSFRKVYGNLYMSTICTGNIRSFIDALVNKRYEEASTYGVVILGFLVGIIIGDFSIILLNDNAIYICIVLLFVVLYILIKKGNKNEVIR